MRWVNSWHNPTDHDSGRITDLYDCDITVPFDPDPPRTRRNRQSTWEPDMLRLWITEGANISDTDHRLIPHRLWAGDSHHAHCEAGRSGYGTAPFFDVERRGHGILLAVGWSGQWQAYFDRTTDALRIRSGIMYTSFRLHPGESFRTSSVVLLEYRDGQAAALPARAGVPHRAKRRRTGDTVPLLCDILGRNQHRGAPAPLAGTL